MYLPNVIIGGTGRAGSTSLFRYLADHPEVCGSSTKETQFFIRHMDDMSHGDLIEYSNYFGACSDSHKVRIEATPHYLQFADKLAPLIHRTLPDVKLIFILREPAGRLFTGYRNLRELENRTFGSWSFDDFVRQAIANKDAADYHTRDPYQRAASYMYTGCYAKYLSSYFNVFGPSRISVLFFDTLIADPRSLMMKVADFLTIDPRFYNAYEFSQENRTRAFRLRALHQVAHRFNLTLEPLLNRYPTVRRTLRDIYNFINEARGRKELPSESSKAILKDFYRPHNAELRALLKGYGYTEDLPAWLDE